MIDFNDYSLAINGAIFASAGVVVWMAGTRIAYYADEFAERFQWSRALLGLLLLAGVTSLPEIATSFTAAYSNNADLAVNNLLGSIAMQIAVLAIADAVYHKHALTSVVPDSIVMLQGSLNIILLTITAIAIIVTDSPLLGAGYWSWGLVIMSVFSFVKLTDANSHASWIISDDRDAITEDKSTGERTYEDQTTRRLIIKTCSSAALILCAGYVVAISGEAIAEKSGLGSSFVGVAFVAIATSLPEASTVFASIKRGLYTMAISDILGTNILNIALIFAVDLISSGDPVLSQVGNFSAVGALLGALVTAIFLMGLAERANKTIWRMGRDSAAVLFVYGGGLVLLYQLRG